MLMYSYSHPDTVPTFSSQKSLCSCGGKKNAMRSDAEEARSQHQPKQTCLSVSSKIRMSILPSLGDSSSSSSSPSSIRRSRVIRSRSRTHSLRLSVLLVLSVLGSLAYFTIHRNLYASDLRLSSNKMATEMQTSSTSSTEKPSLRSFLSESKQYALSRLSSSSSDSSEPMVLIMGNGAGDLDSLTSALSLSYLLQYYLHSSLPLTKPFDKDTRYIPLIQTNRSDAHLRPENIASLQAADIPQEDILYLSDLTDSNGLNLDLKTSEKFSVERNTFLGLVDHAQLELPWQSQSSSNNGHVSLIVDHHADVNEHQDAQLRVFRLPDSNPTGSAQSIIIELFQDQIQGDHRLPKEVADLAISTVLVDTDNLRPMPKGRASQTDISAVELLLPLSSFANSESQASFRTKLLQAAPKEVQEEHSQQSSPQLSISSSTLDKTTGIWQILSSSKSAISHLSTLDLLKRDYKSTSVADLKAGFSSVNLGLPNWLHRDGNTMVENESISGKAWNEWWSVLISWMESQKLDVSVVGTSFSSSGETEGSKPKHLRELVIAFTHPELEKGSRIFNNVITHLESDTTASSLELITPWKGKRLATTGKKERPFGIEKKSHLVEHNTGNKLIWAQVYKQGNVKANRKIYLPKIVEAFQRALR
ncbi:unnamed protein product [Sympodiomycopsis kandeliae]